METLENERICTGGICAGESAKAIELTAKYLRSRQTFDEPLWNQRAALAAKTAAAKSRPALF
jgi:acyl-CoA dehydrogenase